jgi:hypothetical protein
MRDANYRRTRAAQIAAMLYRPGDEAEGPYPEFEDGIPDAGASPMSLPAMDDVHGMQEYLQGVMPGADQVIQPVPEEPDAAGDRRQALARQLMRRG